MTENVFHAEKRFRSPTLLPESFWDARPVLAHIREAARRRMAPPDLTLGFVLARVVVLADPRLRIPPKPGFCSPLSLFVAGMAGSSGGKTTANGVSRELLPYRFDDGVLDASPATGEALLELFWSDEEDENGKTFHARSVQSGLISIDEGSLLEKLDGRSGNTLLPFLLTMWSGGTVGTDTLGTVGKHGVQRRLQEDTYVLSMVMSLQPKKAGHLLSQKDSGLAQRFLWFSDKDPGLPRGVPADHRIVPLQFERVWADADREMDGHPGVREVRRSSSVHEELYDAMWLKRQPDFEEDELAGHDKLNQLRVAHALALLEGRFDVDDEDWRLAGMVSKVSLANRDRVVQVLANGRDSENRAKVNQAVLTDTAIELQREKRQHLSCRKAVIRELRRNGATPISRLGRNMSHAQQDVLHEVLVAMVDDEVIFVDERGRYCLC